MLTPETAAMSGPDQLDALADQTEGQGLQVTAESLRQMARHWRADRVALESNASAWAAHLEAFIGTGALPSLHRSFDAGLSPGGAAASHEPRRAAA